MSPVLSFRPDLLARLRAGIVESCRILGSSYVAHPANGALRARIASGALSPRAYYQQLLWIVYRRLFRAVAEARGLQVPAGSEALFGGAGCPDVDAAQLDDRAVQEAERTLRAIGCDQLVPEELGAVYDGLLGLHPAVETEPWRFGYLSDTARAGARGSEGKATGARGSERKATGAYYTPPELVAELIKSALAPVMAQVAQADPQQPARAILRLKMIDPACGTGHFLLAAARRLADELLRLDGGDRATALRDVMSHCIHGVDKNPLAAELCRAALWLEAGCSAQVQCADALTLDWHQAFPSAMAQGGFDVVLTNPPWEKLKLQEQEFFASRRPAIANARHKAERMRLIAQLGSGAAPAADRQLHAEFLEARRAAEAASLYVRRSGRFPLTGNGDVNTYALFAETALGLLSPAGRAGIIVPTGIATDDSTKRFFATVTAKRQLVSLYSFYEIRRWFPGTDDRKPFALLTLGRSAAQPAFCFDIDKMADLADDRRVFTLSASDIELINPNTKTCPLFRSRADAEITRGIYERVPVLIDRRSGANPWGIRFLRMFDMSGDSGLFRTAAELWEAGAPAGAPASAPGHDAISPGDRWLPLYEAKMIHHFDHRFGTFAGLPGRPNYAPVAHPTPAELADPAFDPAPWYWVPAEEVTARLEAAGWHRNWLFGLRSITNAAAERTVIGTAFPRTGAGNSLPILLPTRAPSVRHLAALIGNFSALVLDFHARQKVGGINLNFFIIEQLAVLPPEAYTEQDLDFIVPRVLELTYTSESMHPFARDLGCHGAPFAWDPGRRAALKAELDARYARLYGLTFDQLRYILDPGPDSPSQTFRVLKENELKEFGEYRTQRLVLEAWHPTP